MAQRQELPLIFSFEDDVEVKKRMDPLCPLWDQINMALEEAAQMDA